MTYNKAGTQAPLSAAAFDAAATGMDVYLDRRRCFVRAFPDMHLGSDTPPSQWFISSLCRCAPSPTCTLRSSSRTRRCAAASRVSSLLRPPPHTTQHARGTRLPIDPSSAVQSTQHACGLLRPLSRMPHACFLLPSSTRHTPSPPSPPSPQHDTRCRLHLLLHRFTTASPPLHRTAGRRPGLHFVAVDGHAPRPVPLPQLRGRVRRHPAERLPRRAPGAYAPPHHSPRRHPPRASASDPPSLADNVLLLLPPPSLASAPRASSSLSDPSRASAPTFRAAVRRVPSRSAPGDRARRAHAPPCGCLCPSPPLQRARGSRSTSAAAARSSTTPPTTTRRTSATSCSTPRAARTRRRCAPAHPPASAQLRALAFLWRREPPTLLRPRRVQVHAAHHQAARRRPRALHPARRADRCAAAPSNASGLDD